MSKRHRTPPLAPPLAPPAEPETLPTVTSEGVNTHQLRIDPFVVSGFLGRALNLVLQNGYLLNVGKTKTGNVFVEFVGFEAHLYDTNTRIVIAPRKSYFRKIE